MKLNYKRTVLIGLAFLSICAFWQMYDSIIPLILQNTFGIGETLTGAIMAADNVLAIFLLPLFGALSDNPSDGKENAVYRDGNGAGGDFPAAFTNRRQKGQHGIVYCIPVCTSRIHGTVPFTGGSADAGSDTE